jgi:glyceraldehyde-3-phosphate dehydrogenase/erythrose-4-phosphate dehydrogenase
MAIFRMGLVGAGRMGRTHLRALAGSDVVRIVAVADPVESVRAAVESPQLSVHTDLSAMQTSANEGRTPRSFAAIRAKEFRDLGNPIHWHEDLNPVSSRKGPTATSSTLFHAHSCRLWKPKTIEPSE